MPTPCFWVEQTGRERRWLRRHARRDDAPCPGGYHDAMVAIEDGDADISPWEHGDHQLVHHYPEVEAFADDPRWGQLVTCQNEGCDYAFVEDDDRQVFTILIWRRPDTGEEWNQRELPAGAMFEAWWLPWKGPDGRSLAVVLPPGGSDIDIFLIDGPARNCEDGSHGQPDHTCWTRSGDAPNLTVSPSIKKGEPGYERFYHGHLQGGVLTDSSAT